MPKHKLADGLVRFPQARSLAKAKNVCSHRRRIQWFSHGIFVLRPHFLRHQAV
jgi:hypothetical protein